MMRNAVFGSGGGFGGFGAAPAVQPSASSLYVAPVQGHNPTKTWVLIGVGGAAAAYGLTKAFGGKHVGRNVAIGAVAVPVVVLGAAVALLWGFRGG
jgi:hypothetical protein